MESIKASKAISSASSTPSLDDEDVDAVVDACTVDIDISDADVDTLIVPPAAVAPATTPVPVEIPVTISAIPTGG